MQGLLNLGLNIQELKEIYKKKVVLVKGGYSTKHLSQVAQAPLKCLKIHDHITQSDNAHVVFDTQ